MIAINVNRAEKIDRALDRVVSHAMALWHASQRENTSMEEALKLSVKLMKACSSLNKVKRRNTVNR